MRFSLMTLLLISLWIGAGLGVWFRREAWVLDRFEPLLKRFEYSTSSSVLDTTSPDQQRTLEVQNSYSLGFWIRDTRTQQTIFIKNCRPDISWLANIGFENNDSISMIGAPTSGGSALRVYYRRCFPEWWWGHLYRPEVWAFTLLSIALIMQAIQALRRRRLARAV